jgi:ribonuclease P protein component
MPEGFGLQKPARLIKSSDFAKVLNAPEDQVWRHQDRWFRILSLASTRPRLGMAIAKKWMPRAVDRNRVRRLIRESFRRHQASLPNRDYVVFARQDLRQYPSNEIREHLDTLLHAIMNQSNQKP